MIYNWFCVSGEVCRSALGGVVWGGGNLLHLWTYLSVWLLRSSIVWLYVSTNLEFGGLVMSMLEEGTREWESHAPNYSCQQVLTRRSRGILFLSSFNFEHPRPCGQWGCISNESVCRRETMNMLDCRCANSRKCVKSVQNCPSIPWQSVGVAARAVRVENAACQNLRGRLLNILVWDHVLYGQWQIVAVYRIDFRWSDFRSCPALVAIAALSSSEVSGELDANRHGVPFTLQLRLMAFFGSIWLYAFQLLLCCCSRRSIRSFPRHFLDGLAFSYTSESFLLSASNRRQ